MGKMMETFGSAVAILSSERPSDEEVRSARRIPTPATCGLYATVTLLTRWTNGGSSMRILTSGGGRFGTGIAVTSSDAFCVCFCRSTDSHNVPIRSTAAQATQRQANRARDEAIRL